MHPTARFRANALLLSAVLSAVTLIQPITSYGQDRTVYWSDRGGIYRLAAAGGYETIVESRLQAPVSLALDLNAGKAYWASSGRIERSNLDGSDFEIVLDLNQDIEGIALDVDGGKLYWTNFSREAVQRSNLDGTEIEDLVTDGVVDPQGIALDLTNDKMYWVGSNLNGGLIHRANLDGTDVEELVAASGVWLPWGIKLDLDAGKMYWADIVANNIQRANLDGTEIEELVDVDLGHELDNPSGLALDLEAGKMYWVDRGRTSGSGRIERANLDGTEIETLIDENLEDANDIALDPVSGAMYWTDGQYGTSTIWTSDLDGLDAEPLLTPIGQIRQFLIDDESGRIYWAEWGTKIQHSNLDGNEIADLVTGAGSPERLTLVDGSIYWLENGNGLIRRVSLADGTVEDLLQDLSYPAHLVVAGAAIFWVEGPFANPNMIYRADLDGSNVEELVSSDPLEVLSLAVDGSEGKIYFAVGDFSAETLHWADLDGANDEEIAEVEAFFDHLTVDETNGMLYWIDAFGVNRAGLDASGAEVVVEQSRVRNLVLDAEAGELYFSNVEQGGDEEMLIYRADLDGSNLTELAAGLDGVDFLVLGPAEATASEADDVPVHFQLSNAYPNPFNPRATVELTLAAPQEVSIALHDALGRRVRTLHQGRLGPSTHRFTIDGGGLASGVYFIRVTGEHANASRAVTLLK